MAIETMGDASVMGETIPRRTILKLHLHVLSMATLGYGLMFMDRVNISFAKLAMGSDLELSDESFGLASGVFFLTYCLMQIPATLLSSSPFGSRRVLGGVLILSGLSSGAMAMVTDATGIIWLRALLGLAEAGYFPSAIYYISRWYPDQAAGQAASLFFSGAWTFATLASSGSACAVPMLDGVLGIAQWRWLFIGQGSLTICVGMIFLLCLPDSTERASVA